MHLALGVILSTLLSAGCLAVPFTVSSTYSITTGGLAFVHASADATTITTAPISPAAPNQVWTVAIASSGLATVQNAGTLAYMATNGAQITPAAQPTFWTLATSGGKTSFCLAGVLCVTFNANSTALLLGTVDSTNAGQVFTGIPATPPRGAYQIQNVATAGIIATAFVPGAAHGTASFPAFDRSQIWLVGTNGSLLSLQNLDSAGFVGLTPEEGTTVGTWTRNTAFFWDAVFEDGVGLVLLAQGAALSAAQDPLALGSVDAHAAWIFHPVDANDFLP